MASDPCQQGMVCAVPLSTQQRAANALQYMTPTKSGQQVTLLLSKSQQGGMWSLERARLTARAQVHHSAKGYGMGTSLQYLLAKPLTLYAGYAKEVVGANRTFVANLGASYSHGPETLLAQVFTAGKGMAFCVGWQHDIDPHVQFYAAIKAPTRGKIEADLGWILKL